MYLYSFLKDTLGMPQWVALVIIGGLAGTAARYPILIHPWEWFKRSSKE